MFIIDIQGFNYGADFFSCKEIAIFNMQDEKHNHKILKMPFPIQLANGKFQKHVNWLTYNRHGLDWNDIGDLNSSSIFYENISEFIWNEVRDDIIYVKGMDKKKWLERIIDNQIIDLYEQGCPSLKKLKSIFQSNHCKLHSYNYLNCALENVYYLWYWYTLNKNK